MSASPQYRNSVSIPLLARNEHRVSSSAALGSSALIASKEISHVVRTVFSPYCHTADGGLLQSVVLKFALKSGKKAPKGLESLWRYAPAWSIARGKYPSSDTMSLASS